MSRSQNRISNDLESFQKESLEQPLIASLMRMQIGVIDHFAVHDKVNLTEVDYKIDEVVHSGVLSATYETTVNDNRRFRLTATYDFMANQVFYRTDEVVVSNVKGAQRS